MYAAAPVLFELKIGWRYLYRGRPERNLMVGAGVGLAVILLGVYLLLTSGGSSPVGVVTVITGMLGTSVCLLLAFFSVLTSVSVLGVVLGVAALTVTLAVATGFQAEFRDKVLGVNAHVIVMKSTTDFPEYRKVEELARTIDPEVRAVQPFIFEEMLVTRGQGKQSGVAIKGVDPARVAQVLDLQKHMVEGDIDSLAAETEPGAPAPIILGRELARKLDAGLGDELTVVAPLSNIDFDTWTATGGAPVTRTFVVGGIFYSGFAEYDQRLMYISLHEAQELRGQGDRVLGVELKVDDVDRAREIADKIEAALGGPPYVVQDWYELNRNLFTALTLQKVVLLIILTLIIVVATFNVVSNLTMMVIDKTREVAILKSMGATSASVAWVFQVVGLAIGGVGTVWGLGIGLTVCAVVERYGYRLDPKVYLIDHLPIVVQPFEVVLIAVITMAISAVAAFFPSAKASALHPVEGLRYE
ncbi:ABC transporter permease [Haliangium sp.]|uniref:ABC transporter permease n=1 Tax=Haliangium sp. TaxID=2663208 RepID=UPI003D152F99